MNLRNILEFSCSNYLIVHGPISNSNMAKSFLIEDSELHVYHISNVDNPDIVTGTMSMLATCFSNLQLMLLRIWGWSQNSVCLCMGNFYISTWQNLSFIQGAAYVLVRLSEPVQSPTVASQNFYLMFISRFLSKPLSAIIDIFWKMIF